MRMRFEATSSADRHDRMPWGSAIGLGVLTAAGIAVFLVLFNVTGANMADYRPLLLPTVLTFALCLTATSNASAVPGRTLLSYAVVGVISFASALIGNATGMYETLDAVVAAGISTILMYRFGLWHTPSLAICLIASLTGFGLTDSLIAFPVLMGLCVLALALVFVLRRLFFDRTYPSAWF